MIEEIKKIIGEDKNSLKLSKFFHGSPFVSTKVLFFVSRGNKPVGVIKMARNFYDNDLIEREIRGIKYFDSLGLKVPKIMRSGEISSLKYIFQKIIYGQSIGKNKEFETFPTIAQYHNKIKKNKKIKIISILDAIKGLDIRNDREYDQVIKLLYERKDHEIYIANQHGDLTHKNIIKSKNDIFFIDFENFGLRSFWGSDITHYMVRMTNVYDNYKKNKDISKTLLNFVQITKGYRKKFNIDISDNQCVDLFLLDLLFEDLQKTYSSTKKEIIHLMKSLWSN